MLYHMTLDELIQFDADEQQVEQMIDSVSEEAQALAQAQEALHPTATLSGTISEVYVHNGDSVNAGTELARIVASTELSIDFLFPFAAPTDFYVGQTATVFVDGYAGSQAGTVTSVSNSTAITSNGKPSVSVRVRLNNPGAVSDAYTASAVIGNYTSYGQAAVSMPASSVVYASGSGTVNGFATALGFIPSIQSGKLELEVADLNIANAKAGYYPNLSLYAGIGSGHNTGDSGSLGSQLKQGFNESIGLTLSIPIYSQRSNKSAVERARIQQKISALDLKNQEKELLNQIESAWLDASITSTSRSAATALAMRRSSSGASGVVRTLSPASTPSS